MHNEENTKHIPNTIHYTTRAHAHTQTLAYKIYLTFQRPSSHIFCVSFACLLPTKPLTLLLSLSLSLLLRSRTIVPGSLYGSAHPIWFMQMPIPFYAVELKGAEWKGRYVCCVYNTYASCTEPIYGIAIEYIIKYVY